MSRLPREATVARGERMEWVQRRHHVEDGYVRPSRSSPLRPYDPFVRQAEGDPLHLALVKVDPWDPDSVADLATQWGPLGVLHEFVIEARYVEEQAGWVSPQPTEGTQVIATPTARVTGTSAEFDTTATVLRASVTAEDPAEELPLADWYEAFFPETPDGPYPAFDNPAIWDHMCEPMHLIEQEVELFKATAALMERTPEEIDPEDPLDGLALLQHRLTRISPTPELVEGQWEMNWRFPSLISAAYYMVYKDLAGGRMLRYCEADDCTNPFVARASTRQKWCSSQCAKRMGMRKLRADAKAD